MFTQQQADAVQRAIRAGHPVTVLAEPRDGKATVTHGRAARVERRRGVAVVTLAVDGQSDTTLPRLAGDRHVFTFSWTAGNVTREVRVA